jgi:hypothetical protein
MSELDKLTLYIYLFFVTFVCLSGGLVVTMFIFYNNYETKKLKLLELNNTISENMCEKINLYYLSIK